MSKEVQVTKILFIDNDEITFQFRKCMAMALCQLPPVELYHASDATEGLSLLEDLKPHVVILDDESPEECTLFLENLSKEHPHIIVQSDNFAESSSRKCAFEVTVIERNDTLEGIHNTLLKAASLASEGARGC